MDYKYKEGIQFKIQKLDGVSSKWRFLPHGSCSDDCVCRGYLEIGELVTLKYSHRKNDTKRPYELLLSGGLESDVLTEVDIDIMTNNGEIITEKESPQIAENKITFTSYEIKNPQVKYLYDYYKSIYLDKNKSIESRTRSYKKMELIEGIAIIYELHETLDDEELEDLLLEVHPIFPEDIPKIKEILNKYKNIKGE